MIRNALSELDPEIVALPPARIDMILQVEDPTFWTNSGIDFSSPGAGGTTITKSLAKGFYYENYLGPIHQPDIILLSVLALNGTTTKQDIFRAFVSRAYKTGPSMGSPRVQDVGTGVN
jgi:hypothetical protein